MVRIVDGAFRKTAVFGPRAKTYRGIGRSDIAQGRLGVENVEVEALTRRVSVRQLQSAYPRVKPPARRDEIGRAEEGLSCLERIRPAALNIGERCQGRSFRIRQLAACLVAPLPQPHRPPLAPPTSQTGTSVVPAP